MRLRTVVRVPVIQRAGAQMRRSMIMFEIKNYGYNSNFYYLDVDRLYMIHGTSITICTFLLWRF